MACRSEESAKGILRRRYRNSTEELVERVGSGKIGLSMSHRTDTCQTCESWKGKIEYFGKAMMVFGWLWTMRADAGGLPNHSQKRILGSSKDYTDLERIRVSLLFWSA